MTNVNAVRVLCLFILGISLGCGDDGEAPSAPLNFPSDVGVDGQIESEDPDSGSSDNVEEGEGGSAGGGKSEGGEEGSTGGGEDGSESTGSDDGDGAVRPPGWRWAGCCC